jgi:hypothetical protein
VSLGLPTARVYGASATPVLPPMPTRAQVCGIRMSFQGLTVPVVEETGYPWITAGPLPWFEAALVCLGPRNRTLAYAAKHAAGDTHALICFSGGMPLYNEPNQLYQRYQAPDFEHDTAAFVALVKEVRVAGFIPAVFFNEVQSESTRLMPLAIAALKSADVRDLNQDVILVPGFDGVFYGWPPAQITAWGHGARIAGAFYLAMEHNTAHIPLGNGPADYAPGGGMDWCDTILSEFDPWGVGGSPGDAVWQIAGRLLGPAYKRLRTNPLATTRILLST